MYADDTVIYFSSRDHHIIEDTLNKELDKISTYLDESELVINLKRGKTEAMLFGTAKRVSKIQKPFKIMHKNVPINNTTTYEYLGNTLDQSMKISKKSSKNPMVDSDFLPKYVHS